MLNKKWGIILDKYRLSRRVKNTDMDWLSCTVGELNYILTVLELNLTSSELSEYEYKIEHEN